MRHRLLLIVAIVSLTAPLLAQVNLMLPEVERRLSGSGRVQ